ncbi:MAG: site-2 protease family protein [Spirochaetes bacterium]|nr:site-2 protease family protein [Spirochaetota bacterium]
MNWQNTLYALPGILIGLTIHECCHAFAAWKLGDSTAKDQGRITLNPLKHIDPIGFLFIVLAGFGWAKPVQFNPERLRYPRRDKAIIAAAGPLSNLVLGILFVQALRFMLASPWFDMAAHENLVLIVFFAAAINFGLFIFNLIPIPPLDGSHIVFSGLNISWEVQMRFMKIGMPLLFVILIAQRFTDLTILPIGRLAHNLLFFFLGGG